MNEIDCARERFARFWRSFVLRLRARDPATRPVLWTLLGVGIAVPVAIVLLFSACSSDSGRGEEAVVTFRGVEARADQTSQTTGGVRRDNYYVVRWKIAGTEQERVWPQVGDTSNVYLEILASPCYHEARVGERLPESCR